MKSEVFGYTRPSWDETERLAALHSYGILDTESEEVIDSLAKVAAHVCDAPIALVSLVDKERQWFKCEIGLGGIRETPRDISICAHTIQQPGLFVVPDVAKNPSLSHIAAAASNLSLHFYAGAPLITDEGLPLGTLCVLDRKPRPEGLTPEQSASLHALANAVMGQIKLGKANKVVTQSEHRYRALVEASATLIWRAAPDGSIIDASSGWKAVSGQGPEDFKGYGWLETVHPDDRERVVAYWQSILASDQPGSDEFRVRQVDGDYRWFATKTVPLLNADGTVQEWVGTITDIHEQKSAAERIHQSEQRYRALINASASVVWRATPDGSVLEGWGSEAFCGHSPEEFKGYGWLNNVHPEDRERVIVSWQKALSSGSSIANEYRVLRVDGKYQWAHTRAVPLLGSDGTIVEWVGTITDIDGQKSAAERTRVSEERYRALIDASASVVWLATADGLMKDEHGWAEISGQEVDDYAGHGWLDVLHPHDRDRVEASWKQAVLSGSLWESELRVRHKDGSYRWALARGVPLKDSNGTVREWVGTQTDIHDRKQAQEALRASEERLRLALNAGRMVAWEYDLTTDFITRSENSLELLGFGSGPLSEFLERTHPADQSERRAFTNLLAQTGTATIESRHQLPDGRVIWLTSRGEMAGPDRIVGVSYDITDRKEAEEELWRAANHDSLTGLPNRALFLKRLEEALVDAKRNSTCVSLLMIDLDHFKEVNDIMGHDAGDALLKKAAARLSAMTRDCDTVARLGGDEFAVLLTEPLTFEHAKRYAEAVTKKLRKPFSHTRRSITTGVSIGIAAFPEHDSDVSELIKDADIALYQAKAQGRSRVVTYSPDLRQKIVERVVLAKEVHKAVSKQQIIPFYQPKVCLSSGRITGFEALARWQHPNKGILTPAFFGSTFDDPELAVAIGNQMMAQVISDIREWLDSGSIFGRVAVNLSSAEFDQEGLADRILSTLADMQVPPQRLEVEVTETVLVGRSSDDVAATLKQLCEQGVGIALDDFGTGYASLTHLKQFPVDHIKIDQSFIRDIEQDEDDEAIVSAVVGLGRSLKLEVTAEGVETVGQVQRLRAMGCQAAQGYLYAKPMAGSQVPRFLTEWNDRLILPPKHLFRG